MKPLSTKRPIKPAITEVNRMTRHGRDMSHFQHLLTVAVDSIAGRAKKKALKACLSKVVPSPTATSSQGIEDFMVVSYLILTAVTQGNTRSRRA
ncbi:hypothetical protein ACVXHB_20250 [Escherichia coli]